MKCEKKQARLVMDAHAFFKVAPLGFQCVRKVMKLNSHLPNPADIPTANLQVNTNQATAANNNDNNNKLSAWMIIMPG